MAAFQDVLSHYVRRPAAALHNLPILQSQAAAAGLAGQQIGTGLYLAAKKREHSVFFVNYHKCNLADFSGI